MIYALMIIVGLGLAAYGVVANRRGSLRYASATAAWHAAAATIEQSWLERMETSTGDGTTVSYRARVAYRYLVDGEEHLGTRPFLCAKVNFAREQQGLTWLAGVPTGATVSAWFDPARPKDAALELNRPSYSALVISEVVGVCLAAFGLFLLVKK